MTHTARDQWQGGGVPVYLLEDEPIFPDPSEAEPNGLLAVGGDLGPERLLRAYAEGIFPWYGEGQPILWHSPDPRTVLPPSALHVSRSLARSLRRAAYEVRLDTAFPRVIRACAEIPRSNDAGTWITPDMIDAYVRLHELGYAHSAEAWQGGELVGGLYGVSLGGCFFGESMFALRSDASKVAFVRLVEQLEDWGFDLVDCQMYTEHLARFGAVEVARSQFLSTLQASLEKDTRRGPWRLERRDPLNDGSAEKEKQ
jgi:leucyl/phenylalanyl-tRNA--protein transferase